MTLTWYQSVHSQLLLAYISSSTLGLYVNMTRVWEIYHVINPNRRRSWVSYILWKPPKVHKLLTYLYIMDQCNLYAVGFLTYISSSTSVALCHSNGDASCHKEITSFDRIYPHHENLYTLKTTVYENTIPFPVPLGRHIISAALLWPCVNMIEIYHAIKSTQEEIFIFLQYSNAIQTSVNIGHLRL